MTYNVFGGTLNLTQPTNLLSFVLPVAKVNSEEVKSSYIGYTGN